MSALTIADGCGPYAYKRPPMMDLSIPSAIAGCFLLSFVYVGSLYVWKGALTRRRDDPETIRQRTISVSVVTLISPFLLLLVSTTTDSRIAFISEAIGLRPVDTPMSWKPLLLVLVLFMGPVALWIVDHIETRGTTFKYELRDLQTLPKIRNILVAPIAEEVVFRACSLPLLLSTSLSPCVAVFLAPLSFGTAHVHHAFELRRQGHEWGVIGISVLFQFTYTSLFGAFVSYVFLRTGQLLLIILIHAWCNLVGFPDVVRIVRHPYKVVLAPILVLGLVLFVALFASWTR